jgi:hypothetical protein
MIDTKILCLSMLRVAGRGRVRRSLEALVNSGRISVSEAREVWAAVFGGQLIAVPATSTIEVSAS